MTALTPIRLGQTDIETLPVGVGTWQWGDRRFWQFDPDHGPGAAKDAFEASLAAGLTFFDTAEIYGTGTSEQILGDLIRESGADVIVASKFAPLPYRIMTSSLTAALDRSLERLPQVDLYQVHWPFSLLPIAGLMERLADAVEAKKIRAVGVSNYSAGSMRKAHGVLKRRGVALASNQVNYSLLHREPEKNGVLASCRELGVTLIAYSPLAQGALTGKYRPGAPAPGGMRRFRGTFRGIEKAMPVVAALEEVGAKYGASASQVAINWLARQEGVLAIPGAKNGDQAAMNAGAVGFRLSDEDAEKVSEVAKGF